MRFITDNESARVLAVVMLLIVVKAGLLGYREIIPPLPWPEGPARAWMGELLETMSNRGLNREAREALTAGYYEGLLNEGSRLGRMNRLVTDNRVPEFRDNAQPDRRETGDFLFYELIPNSDIPDYRDNRARYRLKTNSAGFADREYTLDKPQGVRRIAVMGDSITRGQGAPFGGTFEALLEDALNSDSHAYGQPVFELLNFSVGSYNITQQMEMAFTRAVRYDPDVYVYCLSPLSVYRSWARHLAMALNAGIEIKYDFLKQVVEDAALEVNDPIGVVDAKMARFRLPTVKWVLTLVKEQAETLGATAIVVLVPDVSPPSVMEEAFLGIRQILNEVGLPFVDLLDTFGDPVDHSKVRVADNDRHPNAAGHRLLFERFVERLRQNERLNIALLGEELARDQKEPIGRTGNGR